MCERGEDGPAGERHWLLSSPDNEVHHPVVLVQHAEPSTIVCYSVLPEPIEPLRYVAVMEFLTRANYGLIDGNFELDLADGEVRFKTSCRIEADEIGPLLGRVLTFNLAVFAVYRDALDGVAQGALGPVDAINTVEQTK